MPQESRMFPQLFDTVPDALIVVDDAGRITMANRQAEALFGYPHGQLTGRPIEDLMPEEARGRHHQHRADYMAAPRLRPMGGAGMALVGQRSDGAQFPVEIALSPLESEEGRRYLASIRDVSETQRARQALIRARYDALVARIGQQALESADEDDVVAALPALLADALGVDAVAVAFLREHEDLDLRAAVGFDASGLAPATVQQAARVLVQGTPLVVEDGDAAQPVFPLFEGAGSGAVVPLLDRDRPLGALIAWSREPRRFDHDAMHLLQSTANLLAALLQRRRTEEQLAHSQRLEAVGQLTGGIAHDFNNLLTVMSGSLQLLEMECGQQPEAAELIASALRSVTRGAELTAKLLAFARRQRLSPRAVLPARLLRDLEMMLQRTLGDAIRLQVDCPPDMPAVYADAAQLDAALLNLVLNARDAMPRGGDITIAVERRRRDTPRPDAATSPTSPAHDILFSVIDTGHGMTPETLARAVEPFYTTKGQGRGSGLGLSMVYGFVEQSGGQLRIDSRLGYGTRVDLSLPAARAATGEATHAAFGLSAGEGQRVLVVEDEPEVRNIAANFVRSLGYRVHAVSSAEDALQCLEEDPSIALLFSDVMLGAGMNGKALALAARRLRPDLPVLLTSGYEDAPPVAGGDDFELLRKPYRREQLAAALQRSLAA